MNRRTFVSGLIALAALPVEKLAEAIPTISNPPISKLKTSWSPEAAQDFITVFGLDAQEELERLIRHEIEQEIGSRRGTILREVKYHPQTFASRYELTFVENEKYDSQELWGMQL